VLVLVLVLVLVCGLASCPPSVLCTHSCRAGHSDVAVGENRNGVFGIKCLCCLLTNGLGVQTRLTRKSAYGSESYVGNGRSGTAASRREVSASASAAPGASDMTVDEAKKQ
jgi:hypothetical protein